MKSQTASTSQPATQPTSHPPTRKEKLMKSLVPARPVLWFLFLFNAAVAIAVAAGGHHLHIHGQTLHGTQQIVTCAGMGIVALGAFAGLLRRRPQPA
jgi:4-hydroxybenzoate polyprenyltransferase